MSHHAHSSSLRSCSSAQFMQKHIAGPSLRQPERRKHGNAQQSSPNPLYCPPPPPPPPPPPLTLGTWVATTWSMWLVANLPARHPPPSPSRVTLRFWQFEAITAIPNKISQGIGSQASPLRQQLAPSLQLAGTSWHGVRQAGWMHCRLTEEKLTNEQAVWSRCRLAN